jgi:hypothetical protein
MPLSPPASREPLHRRAIELRGYRRADGLFDVEGEIIDTKDYAFQVGDRGRIEPGGKLHHMRLRITFDETLTIVAAEAVTEASPFAACPGGAESFGRLVGLTIRSGFLKEAGARLAGVAGCTHIRELLQQVATVAYQTSYVLPARQRNDTAAGQRMVDSCFAYAADGSVVRARWPELARAAAG